MAAVNSRIQAAPEAVFATLLAFDRFGDWLSIHDHWPHGPPTGIRQGDQLIEAVRFVGTTGIVTWEVAELDPPHAIRLIGTGPLPGRLSVAFLATAHAAGTEVHFTVALTDSRFRGPFRQLVNRGLRQAVRGSLDGLAAIIATPASAP